MDFKKLKAQTGQSTLTALREKKASELKEGRQSDDRFWTPTVDKAGNGFAIIRFLPGHHSEENTPYVQMWDHGFQGPGGWYIENSLTSLGQTDPVSEFNSKLWNSTTDDKSPEREQARKQKRRLHYISNILVVNDPGNPDNEGKVFLFKYGKKIMNHLEDVMQEDEFDHSKRVFDPFHLWAGANFKLKIRKYEGYRNYDKSEFDVNGPPVKDDEVLEKVWNSQYPLKPFLAPENFKSYAELKAKLTRVLAGSDADEASVTRRATDQDEEREPKKGRTKEYAHEDRRGSPLPDDDGDEMEYFKSLAS